MDGLEVPGNEKVAFLNGTNGIGRPVLQECLEEGI